MELDTVKKIPAQLLENAVDFELSGYGEIFVNKELFPIIEYLSTFPNIKRITFTTNGVLMTPDKIDKLIQYEKVDLVQISIDSLRKDIYEKIRVNAKFDEVINNIKYLSSVKPQWLSIYLKMVLTYDTIDDLLSMIRFAKEISADRLIAFPMHISKEINIKDSLYFNREKANRIYNQAAQLAKDLDVSLSTPPLFDLTKRSDPSILQFRDANRHPCHEPYEVIYIQSNGDIRPCCFSSDSYGNIFHDGVEETWYGKKYNHLRKTVNTEACPSYCKSCGMVEDVNNIFFLIRKGDGFREKGIKDKVNEYLKMNSPKI